MELNIRNAASYVQSPEHVLSLNEVKIDALLLSPAAERKVNLLFKTLEDLGKVTKKLQKKNTSNHSMRAYFDTFLEDYLSLSDRLCPDAAILQSLDFEFGLLKIQEFHEDTITSLEKSELSRMFLSKRRGSTVTTTERSIIVRAAK